MPILLTTPYDPGDNNPGVTYPRAKITGFSHSNGVIGFGVTYGDLVDGVPGTWERGTGSPAKSFTIEGADYSAMVAEVATAGEKIYDEVARVLYEWLISEGHFAGSIE